MTKGKLSSLNDINQEQLLLKAKIKVLQKELDEIDQKTTAFETMLRSHLSNEIIEEQELTVLYKKVQLAKKEKRFAQKKKGKNFKEVEGVKVIAKNKVSSVNDDNKKKIKRLYREAMIFVHPDKFSMHCEKIDSALCTTVIYKICATGKSEIFRT